jgi:hypothetical protein
MGIFLINKLWDFDGFTMGILYSDARIQPIGTIQHLGPQLSFCLTPRNLLVSPMWFGKSKLILVSIHIYPCIFFVESHIILWFFFVSPSLFTSTASWPGKFTSVFAEIRLSISYCWFSPLFGWPNRYSVYILCMSMYIYILFMCVMYTQRFLDLV